METSPKHMRETPEQAEGAGQTQAPIADNASKESSDNPGRFFLKLIGAVLLIIAVAAVGATSCGTAMQSAETESESYGGSTLGSDATSEDNSNGSSAGESDSDSDGYSSTRDDSDDYSYDYSDRDYSSTNDDDEYQRVYDEDSGIYGVVGEDGDGIFAGEDFGMRLNEDGSSIATDGNGNWVMDSDGDGEIDSISIDGGDTWF